MRNPYKRTDVYKCRYQAHARFQHKVSVFHVEQVKKCFPQGCIIFHWACDLMNKGKKCPRGFEHVGRLCQGCAHFSDEKVHHQPEITLSDIEYEAFKEEREEFDDWLNQVRDREVTFWAEVDSIKPRFKKTLMSGKGQIRLDGYILIFRRGYIGSMEFDDYFYANINPRQQEALRLASGDQFEAKGRLTFDRGRIVMAKIWGIDIESRSGRPTWTNSQALVARQSATSFHQQLEMCLHCARGALVDVVEKHKGRIRHKRELYCLEGIVDPDVCYVHALEKIDQCA